MYDDGFRTRSYSYAQVGRAARGFAARLAEAGVHKGDTVAFWGCLLGGIVVVPIDYRTSADFLARVNIVLQRVVGLFGFMPRLS